MVYLGGEFTYAGPKATGNFLVVDESTGTVPNQSIAVSGIINDIIDDGEGGFFLTGDDITIQGTNYDALVRVKANGNVLSIPHLAGVGRRLVRSGNYLVIGGRELVSAGDGTPYALKFYNIADNTYYHSACASLTSNIFDLVIHGQEVITASMSIGNCTGLRSFDIATPKDAVGSLGSFSVPQVNSRINALSISNGRLYVGGNFTSIASEAVSYLAAFDLATGALEDSWQPVVNNPVHALLTSDDGVYAGGTFTNVGGQARVVALFDYSGALQNWNPSLNLDPDGFGVVDRIVESGSDVYVLGSIHRTAGGERKGILKFSKADASLLAFNPGLNNAVRAIFVKGDRVYLGGPFNAFAVESVSNFVGVSSANGAIYDIGLSFSGAVNAISSFNSTLIVGGEFVTANGQGQNGLAVYNRNSGTLLGTKFSSPKQVNAITHNDDRSVFYLALEDGNIARYFSGIDVLEESWIVADNAVKDIKFVDGKLYVVGEFSTIGGQNRESFAEINAATGGSCEYRSAA